MSEKIKIHIRDNIRVLLSKRLNESTSVSERSVAPRDQGPLKQAQRPDDELIVRKSGFINFWDMGQIKSGDDWVDVNYKVLDMDVDLMTPDIASVFDLSRFNELRDILLTPAESDFKTTYRKLEFGEIEKYGIGINLQHDTEQIFVGPDGTTILGEPATAGKWSSQGLKSKGSTISLFTSIAFEWFNNHTGEYKVTNGPTYTSDSVPFALGKNPNVFLVPRILNIVNTMEDFDGSAGRKRNVQFTRYQQLSREFWVERLDTNYTGYFLSQPLGSFISSEPIVLDATNRDDWVSSVNSDTGSRAFSDELDLSSPDPLDRLFSEVAPGSYPLYSPTPTHRHFSTLGGKFEVDGYHSLSPGELFPSFRRIEGQLCGIIQQGTKTYYFWATDNAPAGDFPAVDLLFIVP